MHREYVKHWKAKSDSIGCKDVETKFYCDVDGDANTLSGYSPGWIDASANPPPLIARTSYFKPISEPISTTF